MSNAYPLSQEMPKRYSLANSRKAEVAVENTCSFFQISAVRFCSGGEKVWDIARKYNTTVEDIMSENELTSDEIGEKMMLMIPVK